MASFITCRMQAMSDAIYYETMRRANNKSHCPVNYALETFGDPWSLLIVRDIAYFGKKTYGEFLHSDERISTNILANRLGELERNQLITKSADPGDKRKEIYSLTEKGLALLPAMLEMSGWAARFDPQTAAPKAFVEYVYAHRDEAYALIQDVLRAGGSLFAGPDSVMVRLIQQGKLPAPTSL